MSFKKKLTVTVKKVTVTVKDATILFNGRQHVLNAFESGIFPKGKQGKRFTSTVDIIACIAKVSDCKQHKILTPKQILQRLPIALVQVKAGNASENLLNEIRQIIYFLNY